MKKSIREKKKKTNGDKSRHLLRLKLMKLN
jgi:hypothetical protein